jgi:RING-box protein 1
MSNSSPSAVPLSDAPLVELRRFHLVCQWSWDLDVEYCAICRNLIMELCIECQANASSGDNQGTNKNNTECSVAWGTCNHW